MPATSAAESPSPTQTPPAPPAQPARILLLRSSDADNYASVSGALEQILGATYNVQTSNLANGEPVPESPADDGPTWTAAVAIGLDAAIYAASELSIPTVFCQTFDYRELLEEYPQLYAIEPAPPLALQLASWRTIEPNANSVGMLLAEGEHELAAEAHAAATALGINLRTAFASTDRDAIYQFKRLTQAVDGLWLQPSSTILSPSAIRQILDYALEHDVRTIVFNKILLDWGALLSVGSSTEDIAATVTRTLTAIVNGDQSDLRRITPLNAVDAHLNEDVAQQLGLFNAEEAARASRLLTARDEST